MGAVSGPSAAHPPPVREAPDLAWLRYGRVAARAPASRRSRIRSSCSARIPCWHRGRGAGGRTGAAVRASPPRGDAGGGRAGASRWRRCRRSPRRAPPSCRRRPLRPEDFWITEHAGGSLLVAGRHRRAACCTVPSRCCGSLPSIPTARFDCGAAGPGRRDPLGEPLGQPRRHDRARLRRPVDLLRERRRRRRSLARARLRAAAGVGRHQRLHDQQRQRRHARADARRSCRSWRASRTRSAPRASACRSRSTSAARSRLGGLDTFDPLDPRVAAWWQATADDIYARRSRISAASCSRPIPKGGSGRRPTAARTPTRPT